MSQEPALRYELKYTFDARLQARARTWLRLSGAAFRTAYPSRQVNTLYLDTPWLRDLNANLTGDSRRQKLRLRWYGQERDAPVLAILELKRKQNLLGRKERLELAGAIDLSGTWNEILAEIRRQVPPDWRHRLQVATLPTLLVLYQREYFETPDRAVRATLDTRQQAFGQAYAIRPNLHRRLPPEETAIIELKAGLGQEERLQQIAGGLPIRRSRNSKYVQGLLPDL